MSEEQEVVGSKKMKEDERRMQKKEYERIEKREKGPGGMSIGGESDDKKRCGNKKEESRWGWKEGCGQRGKERKVKGEKEVEARKGESQKMEDKKKGHQRKGSDQEQKKKDII